MCIVTNGSKFPGQVQFRFHPKLDCGNRSYHTKNPDEWKWASFTTKNPAFHVHNFGSNYVFAFWSYHDMIDMYIVQFEPLIHLPLSDLQSDQYSLSNFRNGANVPYNVIWFHRDSTIIGLIANLTAGGKRANKPAQSTYWSCHDMIRTQILIWTKIRGNRKMELRSRMNPAKKLRVYVCSR